MKKLFVPAFALLVLSACGGRQHEQFAGPAERCDMSKSEMLPYCHHCHCFCVDDCPVDSRGYCCKCNSPTEKREACVKEIYLCEEHGEHAVPCGDDAAQHCCKKHKNCALIEYTCPACNRHQAMPGNCENNMCASKGKPLAKSCSASEEWPHGGAEAATPAPQPEKKN